jgi:nitrogen fixation NifU-like protein
MLDLQELYQEIIIDHNRNPHNFRIMEEASCNAQGFNPLCGDKVTVYLHIKENVIDDISFVGSGCAISQASASLMTDALMGKNIDDAHGLFKDFHHMVTEEGLAPAESLNKLAVLAGVRSFPARVKCATLAWHTFEAALKKDRELVSTE